MNELTEFGPENNALGRRWGAQTPLVFTMASDAFPVVHVDFGAMDEELIALRGDAMLAAVAGSRSAQGAGEFGAVGLANPADSGVVAIVEYIGVVVTTAGRINLRSQGAAVSALGGAILGFSRDLRQTERASVRILASNDTVPGDFGDLVWRSGSTAELVTCPVRWVLSPNTTLWAVAETANVEIIASFAWRQRRLATWENL